MAEGVVTGIIEGCVWHLPKACPPLQRLRDDHGTKVTRTLNRGRQLCGLHGTSHHTKKCSILGRGARRVLRGTMKAFRYKRDCQGALATSGKVDVVDMRSYGTPFRLLNDSKAHTPAALDTKDAGCLQRMTFYLWMVAHNLERVAMRCTQYLRTCTLFIIEGDAKNLPMNEDNLS